MIKMTKQEWKLEVIKLMPIEAKPNPPINPERVFAYAMKERQKEQYR